MATHTPGPWRYEASTKTIRSQPANYWLASMNSWDGAVDHDANARIIAAAPDLMAACRAVLDEFPAFDSKRIESVKNICRAAITKAEGRS